MKAAKGDPLGGDRHQSTPHKSTLTARNRNTVDMNRSPQSIDAMGQSGAQQHEGQRHWRKMIE